MQISIQKENIQAFGAGKLTMPSDTVFSKALTRHKAKKLILPVLRQDLNVYAKADDFDISIIPVNDKANKTRTIQILLKDLCAPEEKNIVCKEVLDSSANIRGVNILLKIQRIINPIIKERYTRLADELFPPGLEFRATKPN